MKKLILASMMILASTSAQALEETILFTTTPDDGASCIITSGKGAWQVHNSPEIVTITETGGQLNIECQHPNGKYALATVAPAIDETGVTTQSGFGINADADINENIDNLYPSEIIVELK